MLTLWTIALVALFSLIRAQTTPGTISAPAPYTPVAPGSAFNFSYNAHADYCISSFSFTAYVITEPPTSLIETGDFMGGYTFGTYQEENYPAVPWPTNPPPSQLTMPDFSTVESGWGRGFNCTNCTFYITVLEEWDDCAGALGRKFGLASVPVIYNATTTS
ncbi:hypothetical protein BKA93DRAFT_733296 [Sparassis latifolia]|uniref:Uncharacterized protein n=1 Tax=Sparassis crispa TaxID=139825 RepID=A0A401GS72_9APHY|nr:hypothetical protein SCP_0702530 [Sparassis crispa]GBE85067.1 hypothetical protein SCP_0702530 [Sparassis crispa]